MNIKDLAEKVGKILDREPRLLHLPTEGKAVFVGDTHGDFEATQTIIDRYLKSPYLIVFLGDYVDRGVESERNINFLLQMKAEHPEQIYLLSGNHEGYMVQDFSPANFWEFLTYEERRIYGTIFSKLPFCAVTPKGIIALHGALPDLPNLEAINNIKLGEEQWERIVWGDFVERRGEFLGNFWGRPLFGESYFDNLMNRYQMKILIRSHQPNVPLLMFKKRCLTIFTSHAYMPTRTIVIADLEKEAHTTDDLTIIKI
ncbi:MAG: metallophosphoesterase family protein [Thermodesulfobacteriota bacterium]